MSLISFTCFHYISGITDGKENTLFFSPSESCKTADIELWSVDDYLTPGILFLACFLAWFMGGCIYLADSLFLPPVHNSRTFWPNDKVEHDKVAGWWSEWFSGEKSLHPSSKFSPPEPTYNQHGGWFISLNFESTDHTIRHVRPHHELQRLCLVTAYCWSSMTCQVSGYQYTRPLTYKIIISLRSVKSSVFFKRHTYKYLDFVSLVWVWKHP